MEERLRLLAAFLGDTLSRARSRADSGRSWGGMVDSRGGAAMNGGTTPSPAKRPRLQDGARQELQRSGPLRAPHSHRLPCPALPSVFRKLYPVSFAVESTGGHHCCRNVLIAV